MKKAIIFLAFALCAVLIQGQSRPGKGKIIPFDSTEYYLKLFADDTEFDIREFKKIPSYWKDKWRMIDAINPINGYVYWECRYWGGMRPVGELIVNRGDLSYAFLALREDSPTLGFFVELRPDPYYSRIVAVREGETVDVIDDEKKLIGFMGAVDNMEEVLLHIKANGYECDDNTLIGGAYREKSDRFMLYLMEYDSFPVTYKSVKAILYKNGKFEVISTVTYKKRDVYIMT